MWMQIAETVLGAALRRARGHALSRSDRAPLLELGDHRRERALPAGGTDPLYFTVTVPEWVTAKPSAMATAAFCTNVWYLPETKTTTGVLVDGKPATMAQIAILCKESMGEGIGFSPKYWFSALALSLIHI